MFYFCKIHSYYVIIWHLKIVTFWYPKEASFLMAALSLRTCWIGLAKEHQSVREILRRDAKYISPNPLKPLQSNWIQNNHIKINKIMSCQLFKAIQASNQWKVTRSNPSLKHHQSSVVNAYSQFSNCQSCDKLSIIIQNHNEVCSKKFDNFLSNY